MNVSKKLFFALISMSFGVLFSQTTNDGLIVLSDEELTSLPQVCFNLENKVVKAYLETAGIEYFNNIGTEGISIINSRNNDGSAKFLFEGITYLKHVPSTPESCQPGWTEQPAPAFIVTPVKGTIEVSPSDDLSTIFSFETDSKNDTTFLYNLKPQTAYLYQIINSNRQVLLRGAFKTSGTMRMIKADWVMNVRDIGGWPCDGGRLAYDRIFRGATLDGEKSNVPLPQSDIFIFTDLLGVNAEIDLRGNDCNGLSPLGESVDYKGISTQMYTLQMTGYYSAFASSVKQLVNNLKAGKKTYVHCTWGADRTGTFIAMIEALCGVSEADIVKDWELTSFNSEKYRLYIDREQKDESDQMRPALRYLFDNFGGNNGLSLTDQVVSWFKTKVFKDEPDCGESIINDLRQYLIVQENTSPTLIQEVKLGTRDLAYSETRSSTAFYKSSIFKSLNPNTGELQSHDAFCTTDFIDCSSYSKIIVNVVSRHIASFYDKNHNFIGSISDNEVAKQYSDETVLFENKAYEIPAGAAYVRINMARNSGFAAVLSE